MATINLGDKARDTVSGFEGIAIGRTTWLHGCVRVTLQPQGLHDGSPIQSHSFDEPQLVLVERDAIKRGDGKTGGPIPEPRQKSTPAR